MMVKRALDRPPFVSSVVETRRANFAKLARMFLVVFRNRKRADIDVAAYAADADRMEALARTQPGFLSFKSYTADDDEVVAISEWVDEAAARAWRAHPEHRTAQANGRASYYAEYAAFLCADPRIHRYQSTPA